MRECEGLFLLAIWLIGSLSPLPVLVGVVASVSEQL